MRAAAIGIGSNSTRMLAAEIGEGTIAPLLRLREDTRLFSSLENGVLSAERMMATAAAAGMFCQQAREAGCEAIRLFATSAARDAKNGAEFAEIAEALCGVPLEVLPGEEEARLSFLGAAGGETDAGVFDIGGGSTELAMMDGGALRTISLQLGSSRLLQEFPNLTGDFPRIARERAEEEIRAGLLRLGVRETPRRWVSVGGNGFRLAAADRLARGLDAEGAEGWFMTREAAHAWADRLSAMSVSERARVPGIPASRADVAAHGAILLEAALRALGADGATATRRTNLDGALLEMAKEKK